MIEDWVESYSKGVVQHFRNNACQKGARGLQARVGIHLDQVDPEVLINHEVVTEDFKTL
jgi:hypothetical protein